MNNLNSVKSRCCYAYEMQENYTLSLANKIKNREERPLEFINHCSRKIKQANSIFNYYLNLYHYLTGEDFDFIKNIPPRKIIINSVRFGIKEVLVDYEDFHYLNQFKWHVTSHGYAERYTKYAEGVRQCIKMHREVLNVTGRWSIVDHKDHNPINNQKYNLRNGTQQNNTRNKIALHRTSKYKGVFLQRYLCGSRKNVYYKWAAHISTGKKRVRLGMFKNEIDAAKAYNEAAIKYHGEYAYLNKFD